MPSYVGTPEWAKAQGILAEVDKMGVLGQVGSQFGKLFTTLVADVQLGGFSGKIRGYPNSGHNLVFLGTLPRNLWENDPIPEGLNLIGPAGKNLTNFSFTLHGQRGPAIERICAIIQRLKEITQLFPVTFATRSETFVYQRGSTLDRYYEGQPLGEVLSAIQFGTGCVIGNQYGKPYWRETERILLSNYQIRVWRGVYYSNPASVVFTVKLFDDGILELGIEEINLVAGGLEVQGKYHHNREIVSSMMTEFSRKMVEGFSWRVDADEKKVIVQLQQVLPLDGAGLIKCLSMVMENAGWKKI